MPPLGSSFLLPVPFAVSHCYRPAAHWYPHSGSLTQFTTPYGSRLRSMLWFHTHTRYYVPSPSAAQPGRGCTFLHAFGFFVYRFRSLYTPLL